MRVVFMGTPGFAVPTLRALVRAGHEVVSVISQPDRPAGRGRRLTPPPVKAEAVELGLDVFQPGRIKEPEAVKHLEATKADVFVVVGYGQMIPQAIIDLPRLGCVNVHASLLPKYRGAAPVNWAIVHGEAKTGVTTMRIERRLDAGDIFLASGTEIGREETAVELSQRLAAMGAELLIETIAGLEKGTITPRKQNEARVTYAPILKREDGRIDWSLEAVQVYNRIRGFVPWPGSYTWFRGKRLHVHRATPRTAGSLEPGVISAALGQFQVGCGGGSMLVVEEVQLEGRKRTTASAFLRGHWPQVGETLGDPSP